jgi:hypothetical protein
VCPNEIIVSLTIIDVVFIIEDDPDTEKVPETNKSPEIFRVVPLKVKFDSALAEFSLPSDVKILLLLKFEIVLNPVPEVPEVPELPLFPAIVNETE